MLSFKEMTTLEHKIMSRSSVTDEGTLTSSARLPLRLAAMAQLVMDLIQLHRSGSNHTETDFETPLFQQRNRDINIHEIMFVPQMQGNIVALLTEAAHQVPLRCWYYPGRTEAHQGPILGVLNH